MTHSRQDESQPVPERLPRTFNTGSLWYFEVRGGGQQGPFDSEEEMQQALEEFIRLQQVAQLQLQS